MTDQSSNASVRIGIPLYPNFDSLDVLGPYQTFTFTHGITPFLIGDTPVRSIEGVSINPDMSFEEYRNAGADKKMDILFVPGTSADKALDTLQNNARYLEFLKYVCEELQGKPAMGWPRLTSVCAGSILLATTGVLCGHTVTTHWLMRDAFQGLEGITLAVGYPRYVHDGNVLTGGGIASGIDESLYLSGLIAPHNIVCTTQLIMQYNPKPPYDCGDPSVAPPALWEPLLSDAKDTISEINSILKGGVQ